MRAVKQLDGVESVVNHVELLPSSRRDHALRMNVYRAIFENTPGPGESAFAGPAVHIIAKNGVVTLVGVVNSDAGRSAIYVKTINVTAHVTGNLRVRADQSKLGLTGAPMNRGFYRAGTVLIALLPSLHANAVSRRATIVGGGNGGGKCAGSAPRK